MTRQRYDLQWGRNMRVAESHARPPAHEVVARLQWGRNMRVAERPAPLGPPRNMLTFNGAAT